MFKNIIVQAFLKENLLYDEKNAEKHILRADNIKRNKKSPPYDVERTLRPN